ncbi:hypothetical protein ACWDYH_14910 [Nocardia goodfellowii]
MSWDQDLIAKVDCRNRSWASSSLTAAHNAMQVHRECSVGECDAKTAAFYTLKDAGKLVPDSGRTR